MMKTKYTFAVEITTPEDTLDYHDTNRLNKRFKECAEEYLKMCPDKVVIASIDMEEDIDDED